MMILSPILAKASGSAGGLTAMVTRNGLVFRTRAVPPDPSTPRQQAVRVHFGTLAARWSSVLTGAQRATWDRYAASVKRPNALDDERNIGGVAMFIRSNVPRLVASLSIVDDAPGRFDLGTYTPVSNPAILLSRNQVSFRINTSDAWATEIGAALLVFIAAGRSLAVNFFRGPYRFAAPVLGRVAPLPTPTQLIVSPFTIVPGTRIYWRVQLSRLDGRYSVSQGVFADA